MAASPSLTEQLASFCTRTGLNDIPNDVIERATVSLIHNIAVALAGRPREKHCHLMAERCWREPAEATLLHNGVRVSAEGAAFANGALMHARSQDDTHAGSTSHPGTPVIAAALAVAESERRSGADFLEAVILGYEVLCRIGRDFDELISKRGFRAAAVFGTFGAAAAAAKLMRLNAEQTAHALGLSAQFAGGLSQVWVEGSAEFPLQLGMPARNGIVAARAAASGVTAAREALEGKGGFYRAFAGADVPAREITEGLGSRWQLSEVTVKAFPVCAILQGPVAAMVAAARKTGFAARDVREIELALSPYEAAYPGIDNPGPFDSTVATKMSAQFSLASTGIKHRLTMDDLGVFSDEGIMGLAGKVKVTADPALADRLSRLTVKLTNGHAMTEHVDEPIGQPGLTDIRDFATGLSPEAGCSVGQMEAVVDEICNLRAAPSLDNLMRATGSARLDR